jgi:GntR family transcriptional repressor for pyruvate dehydrogenase complex
MIVSNLEHPQFRDVSLLPETASDSAFRFLRAMIFSGELGPGDRLPPERDLCARLGISRMTLRAALKSLENGDYIVTTRGPRGGSRISDSEALSRCWTQWMRQHLTELDGIFELRNTVETRLAALAAERRTDQDLDTMEAAMASEGAPKDWSSLLHANMDIHRGVARAARSPHLERAMMSVRGELFVPVDFVNLDAKQPRIHDTHRAIIGAIRARDSAESERQMRNHIAIVRELTDRALEASGLLPNGH